VNELRSVASILEHTDSVHAKVFGKSEDSSVKVVLRLADSVDVRLGVELVISPESPSTKTSLNLNRSTATIWVRLGEARGRVHPLDSAVSIGDVDKDG
jgi:hypothetical protein